MTGGPLPTAAWLAGLLLGCLVWMPMATLGGGLPLFADRDRPEDAFLRADQAFVFTAALRGGDAVAARWQIAEGYYLYKARFAYALTTDAGDPIPVGPPSYPPAHWVDDEALGRMEVYRDAVEVLIPLPASLPGGAIVLEVVYQGCADRGLCYSPVRKTERLVVPARRR